MSGTLWHYDAETATGLGHYAPLGMRKTKRPRPDELTEIQTELRALEDEEATPNGHLQEIRARANEAKAKIMALTRSSFTSNTEGHVITSGLPDLHEME